MIFHMDQNSGSQCCFSYPTEHKNEKIYGLESLGFVIYQLIFLTLPNLALEHLNNHKDQQPSHAPQHQNRLDLISSKKQSSEWKSYLHPQDLQVIIAVYLQVFMIFLASRSGASRGINRVSLNDPTAFANLHM